MCKSNSLCRDATIHLLKLIKFIELRIDGPYTSPCGTAGEYKMIVEVNLLSKSTRDESNIYDKENQQGILQQMLNRDFCIYKIGNVGKNVADDQTYVGTMKLLEREQIRLNDFGRTNDDAEVYESVVEAHYEMYTQEF